MPRKYHPLLDSLGFERPRSEQSDLFLTESALQQIESKLGHHLPQDYREFLRDHPGIWSDDVNFPTNFDGCADEVRLFSFCGSTQQNDLADFYYFVKGNLEGDDENCSLEWYPGLALLRDVVKYPEAIGWPEELLPIGFDWAANIICLVLYGLRPGAVFFWRSNPFENKQNLYLLADSFDEFIHSLKRST